ncbi:uncharacterized protein LOC132947208 [Metopolophium dirhodum]|uniref:uncharacterized protein LOC132947208 n=1 Tax=Metopolophium dirhodum TaxID=44670 RepID=UPI00298FE059|nr:uncharacterized protein LOC132947208 [Metopolophium dirhodum]
MSAPVPLAIRRRVVVAFGPKQPGARRAARGSRVSATSSARRPRYRRATAGAGRRTCIGDIPPVTPKVHCRVPKPRPHVIASSCPLPSARGETLGRFHFGGQQQKTRAALVIPVHAADAIFAAVRLRVLLASPPGPASRSSLHIAVLDLSSPGRCDELRLVTGRFRGRLHRWHGVHVVFDQFNRSSAGIVVRLNGFRRVAADELGRIVQQARQIRNRRLFSEVVKYAKLCLHYNIILDVVDDDIPYDVFYGFLDFLGGCFGIMRFSHFYRFLQVPFILPNTNLSII